MNRKELFGKKWFSRTGAVFLILCGIGLLAYPWISNWLYDNQTFSEWNAYAEEVENLAAEEQNLVLARAQEYNAVLREKQPTITNPFNTAALQELGDEEYWDMLCIGDSSVIAYLEIPSISVSLLIYHGTEDETLTAGVGHLEGSSLPIGGEGTHAVLTGHSGLTGKKLFTDLSELEEGDYFYIRVLDEVLAYRITTIQTVLPDEMDLLRIQEGKDLVTLMTCTPYGVNSHRLLVTGTRADFSEEIYEKSQEEKKEASESEWMKSYKKALVTGICISLLLFFLIFLLFWFFSRWKRRKENRKRKEKKNARGDGNET